MIAAATAFLERLHRRDANDNYVWASMYDGSYYQLMAEYNCWMNQSLYSICSAIPDAKDIPWLSSVSKLIDKPSAQIVEDLYRTFV